MLIHNLEKCTFYATGNKELYHIKNDLFEQINRFNIVIDANGYFQINYKYLASVSIPNCTHVYAQL